MPAHRLRFPVAVATAVGVALAIAGPASAHIHTDPASVQAGSKATVGFIVEHGCSGSPTTKVEIQLPDGATDIAGVDAAGFTSSVDGRVVTFSGGTLPDGQEQAFSVRFTVPDSPGDVPVKLIQTCEQGSLEWIELQPAGAPEPEHPAPILTITQGTPDTSTTAHDHDHGTATTTAEHDHGTETTTADHDHGAAATTTVGDHAHDATASDGDTDSDSGSNAPLIAGVVAAVVVIGGGAALYLRSRGQSGPDGGAGDGAPPEPGAGPEPGATA